MHQDPERAGRHGVLYDKVPTVPLDPTKDSKVIVMGKMTKENTDWVGENLPEYVPIQDLECNVYATMLISMYSWQAAIYTVDNTSAPLYTPMNKGREANPYLLYVITHYDQLPETMVFIHPHRKGYPQAWHTDWQDYDMVGALNHLNVDFIQRNGYANLRCNWEPGCPDGVMYLREPNNPDKDRWMDHHMEETWHRFFGKSSRVPERIATPCCAQFAVSGAQARKRPKEEYIRYHQWLMETEYEDDFSGRLLEYLWHVIFGQEPV